MAMFKKYEGELTAEDELNPSKFRDWFCDVDH